MAGRFLPRFYEIVDKAFFVLDELVVDGTAIAAFGWLGGNRVGSGDTVRVRFAHRLEVRGDQIISVEQLLDTSLLSV